jgi:hypothetical protein
VGRDGPHWTAGDLVDDPEQGAHSPRRSRLLLALAAAPWLVVVWLLGSPGAPPPSDAGDVAPLPAEGTDELAAHHDVEAADAPPAGDAGGHDPGGTATDGTSDEPADEPATPTQDPAGTDRPDAATDDPAQDLFLLEQRGRWRVEAGAEEAAALAVVVARAWLTDHPPRLAIADLAAPEVGRYAEHLVVEAVEGTAPELTVVTLLAVLLDGQDDLTATVRRLAVPIALDGRGARPAGAPWWLPGPDLSPASPATRPLEDAADLLAAVGALESAGYEDVTLQRLEDLAGTAAIATVTARTPDGEQLDGPVVLRRHVDRYVVAGDVLARTEPAP